MFTVIDNLMPSAKEIASWEPLSHELAQKKAEFDKQLRQNMISRERLVVVCGPCAADNVKAMSEYVRFLKTAADKYPALFIVARVYTSKPHTDGTGYNGMLFGDDGENVVEGIVRCRKMMIDCLSVGLPVADELLYPQVWDYFSDLVSYPFVGARSGENAFHRAFASGLDLPTGVKNGTDGCLVRMAGSINAINLSTVFIMGGQVFKTDGNPLAHAVLRGGQDEEGRFKENLDARHVARVKKLMRSRGLNDFVMVDLSHANSKKIAERQLENASRVASNPNVDGVMVESYLCDGKDPSGVYGVSRTDDCIGLEKTDKLLRVLNDFFVSRRKKKD